MIRTEQISSIKDERVLQARELSSAAGRARTHKTLLPGAESIGWALEAALPIEQVFYHPSVQDDALLTRLAEKRIPCAATSEGVLKKISETTYLIPLIGVARLPQMDTPPAQMGNFVVVLDRVQDHGNLGTIIRTASAFGIHDIISTTPDLDLYFKKIIEASRGTVFSARLTRFASDMSALTYLKQQGYQIVATSPYARNIQAMASLRQQPIALVVGNETEGVSADILRLADVVVQIPMSGQVESLNVGVAAGISMYELKIRMVLAMLTRSIRSTLGREVGAAAKLIRATFDAHLKQVTDLNGTQVVLMMILKCDETMTRQQMERDTATFGAELDELLQPLLARKYIQHLPDAARFQLTQEGERALAQLWSVVEKAEQWALAGFSEQEKGQLRDFLRRIQANCHQMLEGG